MEGCRHGGLAWLAVLVAGIGVSACNAGREDDTTASVQGNWSGSYTAAGTEDSIPVFALIRKDGATYLFDSNGITYVMPQFTGSVKQSGTVIAYPAMGYTFANGSASMQLDMRAQTSSGQMDIDLDGNQPADQAQSGQAHLLQLETFYGRPSVVAGQWTGDYLSPTPQGLTLVVKSDGSFSGDDAYGCHLQGTLTQLGSQETLFSVSLRSSGSSSACGGTLTGLAHESAYDSFNFFQGMPGTFYYLCASNSKAAFVAEFKAQ